MEKLSIKIADIIIARQTLFLFVLTILTVGSIILLYYLQTPALESFEARTYDLRFKALRGPVPPADNIAIIAINDKSIAELGRFPWSRRIFAELVDRVQAAGAKAMLLDVLFPETENPAADQAFADALARAGNITLAMAFDFAPDWNIKGHTDNIPLLAKAAKAVGHINVIPDDDGVNRRGMLLVRYQDNLYPSLALRAAMEALDVDEVRQRPFAVQVGKRMVPTDYYHTMLINYTGPPGTYPMYSFADVLKGRVPAEQLRGKILFVGMTALGIYDMRVTPFHGNTPGVEINATIADNIIQGSFIRRSGVEALIDLLFIVILGIAAVFTTARFKPHFSSPLLATLAFCYLWFTYLLFVRGHWLSMVYPMASLLLAFIATMVFRFFVLDRRTREIRTIFSSYVSPKIVDRLVKNPGLAVIGGDCLEVTIFFVDIKGFTSFSESVDPFVVVNTLNDYLAVMTRAILDYDGTVDKFLGDGLMAYWGAPLPQKNHARSAVGCVFAMQEALVRLKNDRPDIAPLSFRIGINSGDVIAGNIGAHGKKMEYTVIGDTVNLASRLEGTAKFYGVDILVSESTWQATCDQFVYRELDQIRVVGKCVPIKVYQLMARASDPLPEATRDLLADFDQALTTYRSQQWHLAYTAFDTLCTRYPEDTPARIFRQRCAKFMEMPPDIDWDCVFERLEK